MADETIPEPSKKPLSARQQKAMEQLVAMRFDQAAREVLVEYQQRIDARREAARSARKAAKERAANPVVQERTEALVAELSKLYADMGDLVVAYQEGLEKDFDLTLRQLPGRLNVMGIKEDSELDERGVLVGDLIRALVPPKADRDFGAMDTVEQYGYSLALAGLAAKEAEAREKILLATLEGLDVEAFVDQSIGGKTSELVERAIATLEPVSNNYNTGQELTWRAWATIPPEVEQRYNRMRQMGGGRW